MIRFWNFKLTGAPPLQSYVVRRQRGGQQMAWSDELWVPSVIAINIVGQAVLLLLLRRWTRRWWVAVFGSIMMTPFTAFFLTGGIAWLATYYRVVVCGDTSVPDRLSRSIPQYLSMTFGMCGMYGVMFAQFWFWLPLPLVILWRLMHPSSF